MTGTRYIAQRRPGPKPRRHQKAASDCHPSWPTLNEGRGQNPGDTCLAMRGSTSGAPLNEGRGQNPGDTPTRCSKCKVCVTRSTKAGAKTPATPDPPGAPRPRPVALNEGRGQNPGDTGAGRSHNVSPTSLNEGRGQNPGDTSTIGLVCQGLFDAQRRPGPKPRRH